MITVNSACSVPDQTIQSRYLTIEVFDSLLRLHPTSALMSEPDTFLLVSNLTAWQILATDLRSVGIEYYSVFEFGLISAPILKYKDRVYWLPSYAVINEFATLCQGDGVDFVFGFSTQEEK